MPFWQSPQCSLKNHKDCRWCALSAALTQKQLSTVALIHNFVILIATILSFQCLVFWRFHDQRRIRRNLDHTLLGHGRHGLPRTRSSSGFVTRVPVPLVEGLRGRLRKKGRHFDLERPIKGPFQRVRVGWDNSRRYHYYAEIPYRWRVATPIWLVLLIGRAACEICFNQSEALPRSG